MNKSIRFARQLWLPLFAMQKGTRLFNCPRCGGGIIRPGGYGSRECGDCFLVWTIPGH